MTRSLLQRCALVVGVAVGVFVTPAAARAQKALVYCPVSIDATGCNAIVTALTGPAYPLGIDRGYDGTNGTVDLKTVDLFAYSVFVVPSLADGSTSQPYAKLREPEVVEHLKAALIGRIAMWSGTPDQGATNRALKDALIQNLAAWAGGAFQTAKGPGVVTLLDASSSTVARYDWVRAITPVPVTADANLLIYDAARALDSRGTGILTSPSGAIAYSNLATFGFQVPNGAPGVSLDAVGQTGTSQGGQVILLTMDAGNTSGAVVRTDKDDYAPGQTVTITGLGWQPGETVKLTLHMDPLRDSDAELTATADASGNFTNTDFAPRQYDVGVRFVLTAVGQASGLRAQTTFTDGNGTVSGKVVSSASGNPISGATVTCTAGCNTGVLPTTTNASGDYTLNVNFPGNGPATLTISVSATGFQTASAQVTMPNNQADVPQNFTLAPNAVATTTTITADNPDPSDPGEAVNVAFSVQAASGAAAPTGLVTVSASGTETCTGSLASSGGGLATGTCSITLVGSGSRTLTANYAGATGFGGSSDTEAHTVRQATSTALASDANPSKSGQQVTFTATVTSGGNAVTTGAVTLVEGSSCAAGTTVGTATNVDGSGKATFQISNLLVGSHSLIACYAQTGTFAASSGALTQTVNKAATTTTLSSSQNPANVGQSVTLTATVTTTAPGVGTATGNVTFKDGGSTLGTGALDATGTATFTTSTLTVGNHNITAEYAGDAQREGSTSAILVQSITQIATTTTLTAAPNPSVFGQAVTFTATVASAGGVPSGTVTFKEGGTALGTASLDGTGKATFSTTTLAVGSHPVTAEYAGAGNFAPSASAVVTQVVNQASSATAIASSVNPSVFSQSVTFTATVTAVAPGAGTPTGSVTFNDGATSLGTVALVGGTASVTTSSLTVGTHNITATYGADINFSGSTSSTLSQQVNKAPTTTAVVSSKTPTAFGESVTFTATVTVNAPAVGTPTGSIEFRDGTTVLSTVPLVAGQATLATATLSVASHTISAVYSGDASFATSTGSTTQVVEKAATTTSVSGAPNPSVFGQQVTFTATVAVESPGAGTPTGSVNFYDGGTLVGSGPLSGLTATFSTSTLSANTHSITATYVGDGNFQTSTSSVFSQVVNKAPTTTALTSNANPSVFGQQVTFKATVTVTAPGAGTPSGTVKFKDGATDIGEGTLNASGEATFATTSLSVGGHTVTAHYVGDASFLPSTSGAVNQTVNKAATSSVVASSLNPSTFGQTVTFTAKVTPVAPGAGTPTGTVTFKDGATTLGTGGLDATGTATFSTASLVTGTHNITVAYPGDGNFEASTSKALSQGVNKFTATTAVTVTPSTQQYSDKVTFEATVTPDQVGGLAPATGVTFKVGSQTMGTAPLVLVADQLKATLSNVALLETELNQMAPGPHTVTAEFTGVNTNFIVNNATTQLTITKEDARATYTGLLFVSTPSTSSNSATITLRATIQDITAALPASDADAGDIRKATVKFVDRDAGDALLCTATLGLINAADVKTASASCDWNASITSGDAAHFTIGIVVDGYYTRNASDDDAIVTLAKPYTGFITGGGYLINQASSGSFAGGNGLRSNFGFNVKNNKSGSNLQGAVNIIVRSNGKVYQIKSNAINSMTATLANGLTGSGTAQFSGKANLRDITNPLAPVSLSGNLTLNMTLTDKGEPGSSDTIGFTLWDGNTLVYSSNWSGANTIEQLLNGGNTQVR